MEDKYNGDIFMVTLKRDFLVFLELCLFTDAILSLGILIHTDSINNSLKLLVTLILEDCTLKRVGVVGIGGRVNALYFEWTTFLFKLNFQQLNPYFL